MFTVSFAVCNFVHLAKAFEILKLNKICTIYFGALVSFLVSGFSILCCYRISSFIDNSINIATVNVMRAKNVRAIKPPCFH